MSSQQANIKKSVLWVGAEKFSRIFFQLFTSIVLARLLSPTDYGTVAMLSIFIGMSSILIDAGLGGSLVYYKDTDDKDYSTVFWLNISISLLIYVILFVFSDSISYLYEVPILSKLIKVLGLVIVFNSLGLIQYTLLYKNLEFKKITSVSIISYVASAIIAIALAFLGFGVWALIAQQVLDSMIKTFIYTLYSRFTPRLVFSKELLKKHWLFGKGLLFSSLLRVVYDNMYLQLIGKYCSIDNAGFYNQAKRLKDIPGNLFSNTFETALFPIFSKYEDKTVFDCKFREVNKTFSLIVCASFILISLLSEQIVSIMLGDKWQESTWILSIISIGTIFYIFESVNRSTLKAKGLSDLIFKIDLLKRSISILLMIILIVVYNIQGIVWSFIINSIGSWLVNIFVYSKHSGYTFRSQFWDVITYLIYAFVVALPILYLKSFMPDYSSIATILIIAPAYIVLYTILLHILKDSAYLNCRKLILNKIYNGKKQR